MHGWVSCASSSADVLSLVCVLPVLFSVLLVGLSVCFVACSCLQGCGIVLLRAQALVGASCAQQYLLHVA